MRLLVVILALSSIAVFAQTSKAKKAQTKIAKRKWVEAKSLLNKALRKDPRSVEALFIYSALFSAPTYHKSNVDSAKQYLNQTFANYQQLSDRDKERLKKFPIDDRILGDKKKEIDSTAFEVAKDGNTEQGYVHFIEVYGEAVEIPSAIELRDEAAFVTALKENTYEAFRKFVEKYPDSHRSAEAEHRYERLLYEFSTKDKSLSEFKKFYAANPKSEFADEALNNIFEQETIDGSVAKFKSFIEQYPETKQAQLANKILFHLQLNISEPDAIPDSLAGVYPLDDWLAVNINEKWGFINDQGKVMLQPTFSWIEQSNYCSSLSDDFFLTNQGVYSRLKYPIRKGSFTNVEDLGSGFLLLECDTAIGIVHKSGFIPKLPEFIDASVIANRFLALKTSDGWGLFSLIGKQILPFSYSRIASTREFLIFTKGGKESLAKPDQIEDFASGKYRPIVADEVKSYGGKNFWIRNASLEGIVDENFQEIVPLDRQSISLTSAGLLIKKDGYKFKESWPALDAIDFVNVKVADPWLIARKSGEKPSVYFIPKKMEIAKAADSIWFDQSMAFVKIQDSVRVWISSNQSFNIPASENYIIKKSKDSLVFIISSNKSRSVIYRADIFKRIFSYPTKVVDPVLKDFFIVTNQNKTN